MKTTRRQLAAVAAILAASAMAQAQNYNIDWSTVDSGGGTSTGGVYVVSGTIGQPDAGGTMSGGTYALDGGFWSLVSVVQTPGAPRLIIWRTVTNTIVVTWPNPSTGFTLQQNADLNTVNWSNVTTTPIVVGEEKQVIVSPPAGNRFYRLKTQ